MGENYMIQFIVVEMSSYDPDNGYRRWFEIHPQSNPNEVFIDLENMTNES